MGDPATEAAGSPQSIKKSGNFFLDNRYRFDRDTQMKGVE
jgi:hypothetical protein